AARNAPDTLTPAQMANNLVTGLQTEALKRLTEVQARYMAQLFDMGQLTNENAHALGVTAVQFDVFKRREEETIQTQARLSEQIRETTALTIELGTRYGKTADDMNARDLQRLERLTAIRGELMIQGAL